MCKPVIKVRCKHYAMFNIIVQFLFEIVDLPVEGVKAGDCFIVVTLYLTPSIKIRVFTFRRNITHFTLHFSKRLIDVLVTKLVRIGIVGFLHAEYLSELVRAHYLISSKLIGKFSKARCGYKLKRLSEEHYRLTLGTSCLCKPLALHLIDYG